MVDSQILIDLSSMAIPALLIVIGNRLPYPGWIKAPWTYVYGVFTILLGYGFWVVGSPDQGNLANLLALLRVVVVAGVTDLLLYLVLYIFELRKQSATHQDRARIYYHEARVPDDNG